MSAPPTKPKFKTSFKSARTYEPIHTGGKVALSGDGNWLISTLNEQALVTESTTGKRIKLLKGDSSAVTSLAITPSPLSPLSGGYLLTCTRSMAIEIYSLPTLVLHKTIAKAHDAPLITSAADPTGTLFATGASDGSVKVWDPAKGYCTHIFKGHGGVISALVFDIDQATTTNGGRARLVSGADDCKIRVWDLRTRECLFVFDGHVSVIRGLDVTHNGKLLVSGGRDRVVNVWDLERGVLRKTIPVFETLESVGLVKGAATSFGMLEDGKGKEKEVGLPLLFTGGDKGIVRLWDLTTGEVVQSSATSTGKVHEITDVIYTPTTSSVTAIYVDQNIVTRRTPSLAITQQITGFNDEVIDTALLSLPSPTASTSSATTPPLPTFDTHLAVATNSDLIRVYDLERFDTALLEGHEDVVLCLDKSTDGSVLFSGSKDKTARIWKSRPASSDIEMDSSSPSSEEGASGKLEWDCVGICTGHVESVGAIAVSRTLIDKEVSEGRKEGGGFLLTASQDRTVKMWDLGTLLSSATTPPIDEGPNSLRSLTTLKIHEKDINTLSISPNNALLASGSQDRTAKLFRISYAPATKKENSESSGKLVLLGSFVGHKRGVWCVRFSPIDMCLATASGDRTVKLWNLNDFSCIKTFEGHSNSVLRVDFLTRGMQLVSCASDGLVKVWNVKDEECATTLDGHEEKIWALAIGKDEKMLVSGGADSVITFWEDVTEAEELERIAQHENTVLKEQDFENYLTVQDYSSAIRLALSMDQPRRLLKLFTLIRSSPALPLSSTLTGNLSVDVVIKELQSVELRQLLGYVREWNTSARTAEVAQGVLYAVFKFHSATSVLDSLEGKVRGLDGMEVDEPEDDTADIDSEGEDVHANDKNRKSLPSKKIKTVKATEVLGALIPYTERHFSRADKMVRESFIVEHLLGMMDSFEEIQEGVLGI